MFRKTLMSGIAAVAILGGVSATSAEEWMALAINHQGWGYATGRSESQAKLDAFAECRYETGVQCYAAVSVPWDWYLVGIYCNGQPSVAASQWDYDRAENLAAQKLGYDYYDSRDCETYAYY